VVRARRPLRVALVITGFSLMFGLFLLTFIGARPAQVGGFVALMLVIAALLPPLLRRR